MGYKYEPCFFPGRPSDLDFDHAISQGNIPQDGMLLYRPRYAGTSPTRL